MLRTERIANRVERALTAQRTTGTIMLLLAASQLHRPRAQLSLFVTQSTNGMLNAYGLATLFALCGLYLCLRRPRPNAFYTFLATLPLAGYALAAALWVSGAPTVSMTIAILALGNFLYTVALALRQSREELDDGTN